MKRIFFAIVALVVAFIAYSTWPIVSAARLEAAVQRGDQQEVGERIDFVAVRRSLGRQLARAYLAESGRGIELGGFGRSAAVGAGTLIAQAYLEEILTPQNMLALLREGRVPSANGVDPAVRLDDRLSGLTPATTRQFLRTYFSSGFSNPMRFVLRARNSIETSYSLVFALQGFGWRVVEFDLPSAIVQQLVRELTARQSKSRSDAR